MSDKPDEVEQKPDRLSLRRWSRRKLEAAQGKTAPREGAAVPAATTQEPASQAPRPAGETPQTPAAPLPPIESLTNDSEFAAFFKPEVPEATKRAALKQLFRDPRFNVMDGLDVYIDDYTQPDPIPAEMMKQLAHVRHIFDPPKTEVNAEGYVVDVVDKVAPESVTVTTTPAALAGAASAERGAPAQDQAAGTDPAGKLGDRTPS
jgi:hypothetical protein